MKFIPKKILPLSIILLVLAINLFLGLSRLEKYSAVDEPYWTYDRTPDFWKAVKNQQWSKTDINDKPGITVALLSGFGLFKEDPLAYKSLRDDPKTDSQLKTINDINFYFRLPIFLFYVASLPFFYFFLKKLFDRLTALLGFIFIGLSPIILGISLIINPDSLLWIFFSFSMLTYLIFQKNEERKYLFLSGIFLGFSLLTKYVANILYIFFFILPFLNYIFAETKPQLKNYLKKSLVHYLLLTLVSMLTFFIFYPAAWKDINILWKGTFLSDAFKTIWPVFAAIIFVIAADIFILKNKIAGFVLDNISGYKHRLIQIFSFVFILLAIFTIADTYLGMKPFDFEEVISSPKGIGSGEFFKAYARSITANIYVLIFGISPIALVAFLAALVFNLKKKIALDEKAKAVFYFSLFILLYYFASTFNDVIATVRYQIIIYPLAMIMSAIGLFRLLEYFKFKEKISPAIIFAAAAFISLFSLFSAKPFYFTYASDLLPNDYILNFKDMGDGSYEAAEFLNKLPNAGDLRVWSDKGAVCAVFIGNCSTNFKEKDFEGINYDYFVVSTGRWSRTLKLSLGVNDRYDFDKAYKTKDCIFELELDENPKNFVKIIDARNILRSN